jgi:hypothetical protein
MEVQEAIRQAEAHLKNAQELAPRPVGKEELLYMWDNQITALDNFLADTEAVNDPAFKKLRGDLRDVKKKLTDAVVAFEASQAGEEPPKEDGMKPDEWVASYTEMAGDMVSLVKEALDEKVKGVQDLVKWEEPLAVINGYLADSEPFQEMSRELRKARSVVRIARKDLKGKIDEVFQQWKQSDRASAASGDDDEDED